MGVCLDVVETDVFSVLMFVVVADASNIGFLQCFVSTLFGRQEARPTGRKT